MKSTKGNKKIDTRLVFIIVVLLVFFIGIDIITRFMPTNLENVDLDNQTPPSIHKLVINEVLSNNGGIYASKDGAVCDYIELYNGTDQEINLKGYGLSDRTDEIKFVFQEGIIAPYGYYVVNCTGTKQNNGAEFRLDSKGGETIILTTPNSKVIDSVKTVYLGENQVMVRLDENHFGVSDEATPGFENSKSGKDQYWLSLLTNEKPKIVVNELLITNRGNFVNENGRMDGFLEIKNISNSIVDLSQYSISNSKETPFKYQFDSILLSPNEIYTIYTGNGDYRNQNYLGFNFANKEGEIVLSYQGKVISYLQYRNVANGQSYCYREDGYYVSSTVSFQQENTPVGVDLFQQKYLKLKEDLIINEVMNRNSSYLPQNGTNYYDWIELFNNTDHSILLSDYYLSVTNHDFFQYRLPEFELNPGQYYVLMCSGDETLSNGKYIHAPLKLSAYESLYLSTKDRLVDCLYLGDIPANYSYGRNGTYGAFYMDQPTPFAPNRIGKQTIAQSVTNFLQAGIYDNVQQLVLQLEAPGKIYYTLDGSTPDQHSTLYTAPIQLTKTAVVKAINMEEGSYPSNVLTQSYIINENHTMDVVSISLNASDLYRVHTNYTISYSGDDQNSSAIADIELLSRNETGFHAFCEISVGGGYGKTLPKKSYTIRFNKKAGQTSLDYPVFANRECSSYDTLFLRSSSTDYQDSLIKDLLACSLVDEHTDIDTQAYRAVILYLNGQYWGIYTIREKINEHFIEDHYNVETTGLSIVESGGFAKYGSYSSYEALRRYAKTHDLSKNENYEYVCSKLNIDTFVDYWVCELYTNNYDLGNVRYFSSPAIQDGKFLPIFYDIDHGFHTSVSAIQSKEDDQQEGSEPKEEVIENYDMWNIDFYWAYLLNPQGMGLYRVENDLLVALFKNQDFRQLWYERLAYQLSNTFTKDTVLEKIDQLYQLYQPEIARDAKRWGYSVSNWENQITALRDWAKKRPKRLVDMTVTHFGLTAAQKEHYFSGLY